MCTGKLVKRFGLLCVLVLTLIPWQAVLAEGSWQMGLFEGPTFRQPLYETNAGSNRSVLRVDIENPGEVINVLACGTNNSNNVRVRIYNPNGNLVYQRTDNNGNVDCDDPFTGTFDPQATNAHQYTAPATGTYELHLTNFNGTLFKRFDVTVTNDIFALIDPQENGGRLWSNYWYFWAGSFAEHASTDADLFVVADAAFTGTYNIWKLDLNNFAGYGYGLKANNLGVNSPNAAGDTVAGISVPSAGNAITEQYPMYLSYPSRNYPLATQTYTVSELVFEDSEDSDNAIMVGGDGNFTFSTDITNTAVYEIIIDTSAPNGGPPDGIYGKGDVFLRGDALSGANVIPWDGNDNNGQPVPFGAYSAELSVRAGEFHFVSDDVETSGGPNDIGLRIRRANADGTDSPVKVYWDDFTVLNSTSPDAFNQIGIFDGDHNWGQFNSGGVGNVTLIDTYAFGTSVSPSPAGVAVVPDGTALIGITKSFTPQTIQFAGISNMQFEIVNSGTTTVTGVNVSDKMPSGMSLVTAPGSISVAGTGCSGFTFSPDTVVGGDQLNIVDGQIAGGSTCIVSANVTGTLPGDLINSTSGVLTNEVPFGVISNAATLTVQTDTSGASFACDASFYELETVANQTRLYNIDRSVVPYVRSEFSSIDYAPSSGYEYSALAYNPSDNYLYAIVTLSTGAPGDPVPGSILRIDSAGKVVNLGVPAAGATDAMPTVSDRFVGGTFTTNGGYVVVTDTHATSFGGDAIPNAEQGVVLTIDVTSTPPQVLVNRTHGRDVGDIAAHANGNLYSYTQADGLIGINNINGAVSVTGGNLGVRFESLMADNWFGLYGHNINTGQLVSIDTNNGNGTVVSAIAGGMNIDGASCAYGVSVRKTVDAAEVEAGTAVQYTLEIVNAAQNDMTIDITDNLQDSRTYVAGSLVNPLGGAINGYENTNLLTINGAVVPAGSIQQIQFDVLYPGGYANSTAFNQAQLKFLGGVVQSDYPTTPGIGDATPIEVVASPGIGVSKSAQVSGSEVTYWFTVENIGASDFAAVVLNDNLDTVFGVGNYTVVSAPIIVEDPGTVVVNGAFTGSGAGATLIDSGSTLAGGARVKIRVSVSVDILSDVGSGVGVYSNQVTAKAKTQLGNTVTDVSVDGDNVDPNGDGNPDEQSPTIVTLSNARLVTGIVFEDNGAGAIAHDGVMAGTETPLPSVAVELRDAGGVVIGSDVTDTAGKYAIVIPASAVGTPVQVVALPTVGYQSISELFQQGNTGAVTDGQVQFTAQSISYQVDFGRVATPQFMNNSSIENAPDTVVFHPHQYKARSSGTLSFDYTSQISQASNSSYSAVLYLDENCNGVMDSVDTEFPASLVVNVDTNPEVCVLNKVFIPSDTQHNDTYTTTLKASLIYEDANGTGHGLTDALELIDITRTVAQGQGILVLAKSVQNLSDGTSNTSRNSALPNEVLRYIINYQNNGTGTVTEVLISDSTPAFSSLEVPVQCPATLPNGIVACQVLTPSPAVNTAGYEGPVEWQLDGALAAGAGGSVSFEIRIE